MILISFLRVLEELPIWRRPSCFWRDIPEKFIQPSFIQRERFWPQQDLTDKFVSGFKLKSELYISLTHYLLQFFGTSTENAKTITWFPVVIREPFSTFTFPTKTEVIYTQPPQIKLSASLTSTPEPASSDSEVTLPMSTVCIRPAEANPSSYPDRTTAPSKSGIRENEPRPPALITFYQVTAVTFNDTADKVISGGINNEIKIWDLRKPTSPSVVMAGHTDTITSISLSPDGSYVLSNGMDNALRIWDVRPFAPDERCVKVLMGHQHNFEKNLLHCCWSPDGEMVASGSADRCVYVWDTTSRRIMYKLPGHLGSVNDVHFHNMEPIGKW